MKQIPDRKKQRREYLAKKGDAVGSVLIYVLLLLSLIIAFVGGAWAFFHISEIESCAVALLVFVGLMGYCCCGINNARMRYRETPYVPPVKPDNLPAEEILVRGSEEPPVKSSDILLRATQETETAKDELLRASRDV